MTLLDNSRQISVLVEGLDHPEGIAWGPDGYAYAGGEAGQIYRIDIEKRTVSQLASTGGFILGLAFDGDGNLYACDLGKRCVQRVSPDGTVSVYSTGTRERPMFAPNYPGFDREGNLYVCDSGHWKADDGLIYRIRPGGATEVWSTAATTFPNGLCLGPGGDYLYVAMSVDPPRVIRLRINRDGSAGAPETVREFPGTVPDGLAFDVDGNLYMSCYRPDRIYRLTPGGKLDIVAEDWEGTLIACPTNIAFCGPKLDILLGANLGRWHITRYDLGVKGLPLNYPKIAR
ncbi:MAG: SMP-30/gluconolactonase/LRE family protein [SAR202 cluster bacterium]|nr:SMP-30/gluconolactonase/LRE family protein [SAR202 cluster bacterium]